MSRGLDQILKNDTDLSEADRRITGTEQFYKIDNTIRVADFRKYFPNNTLSVPYTRNE